MKRMAVMTVLLIYFLILCGCGGGQLGPPSSPQISVALSPTNVTLQVGKSQLFTPTVDGTTNKTVSWAISSPTAPAGTDLGSISSSGIYTAPSSVDSQLTVNVIATSTADPSKSATATVTIPVPPPTVTGVKMSPTNVTLASAGTQQFATTVTGTGKYDQTVTWYVCDNFGANCAQGGNATLGTISTGGLYAALTLEPLSPTLSVTVKAVANGDNTQSATAAVTVNAPPVTKATLIWKQLQSYGSGVSFGNISLLNDVVVASGFRGVPPNNTLAGFAGSYSTSDGTLRGTLDLGTENQDSDFVASLVPAGKSFVLLAGEINGLGAVVGVDANAVWQFENTGPSMQYAGMFTAAGQNQEGIILGLTNKPAGPPSFVLADLNGNFNATGPQPSPVASGTILPFMSDNAADSVGIAVLDNLTVFTGDTTSVSGSPITGFIVRWMPDTTPIQKNLPGVRLPRPVIVKENGSSFIYLVGTLILMNQTSQPMWADKLDQDLNEVTGWPKIWDGDNPNFTGFVGNWGNSIVPNPSASGVIAVGATTKLPPNTDTNRYDCALVAYDPDGNILWKTRQDLSDNSVYCAAAAIDASTFSLFIAGAVNQQGLVAKFTLPH